MIKEQVKRYLSLSLVIAMLLSCFPLPVYAEDLVEGCVHHAEHTETCGYAAAVPGADCTHQHGDPCYAWECAHVHGDCGYAEETEMPCEHICSQEEGCTEVLACQHVHDDVCGYVEAREAVACGFSCPECTGAEEEDAAVAQVELLMNALPSVDEVKAMAPEEQAAAYDQTMSAYEAFAALTDAQKAELLQAEAVFGALFDYFNSRTETLAEEDCDHENTSGFCPVCGAVPVNALNFPDDNFRGYILEQIYGADAELTQEELAGITDIDVSGQGIKDLTGIGFFTTLDYLICSSNPLTELDMSGNPRLEYLFCADSKLTKLDVTGNMELVYLACSGNQLTELFVSGNTKLVHLYCDNNQLKELNVSKNSDLKTLICYSNQLTKLDVSNNTKLEILHCYYNQLAELNVSQNTALLVLSCYSNQVTKLDVSSNAALKHLDCDNNQLTELDVRANTALEYLGCSRNRLTELDISKNTALEQLYCYSNQLTKLNVSSNTALSHLSCFDNQLTELDVSSNTALQHLFCSQNQLTELDLSKNAKLLELDCNSNALTALDLTNNHSIDKLSCEYNQYRVLDENRQFDLSELPDSFDLSKASNWTGGTVTDGVLTMTDNIVTYSYQAAEPWTVTFSLAATGLGSVYVAEMPDKTEYVQAWEDLDLTGAKLALVYPDEAEKYIDITPEMVTGFDNTQPGELILTVNYKGHTTNFAVSIIATSGRCGDNAFWKYDVPTGTLTIHGEGPMYDYLPEDIPWRRWNADIVKGIVEDGVTYVCNTSFSACRNLEAVQYAGTVKAVEEGSFANCSKLTSVALHEGVQSIGEKAFQNCTGLTEIVIPKSVQVIAHSAFDGCTSLSSVDLQNGVEEIAWHAFNGCVSLKTIEIPDSVTEIAYSAFMDCSNLSAVQIQGSIESIGDSVFDGCTNLKEIHFNGDAPGFSPATFYYIVSNAYYPAANVTWQPPGVKQDYGGDITWIPVGQLPQNKPSYETDYEPETNNTAAPPTVNNDLEITITKDLWAAIQKAKSEQARETAIYLKYEEINAGELNDEQILTMLSQLYDFKAERAVLTFTVSSAGNDKELYEFLEGSSVMRVPFTPEAGTRGEDYAVFSVDLDGDMQKMKTVYEDGCLFVELHHFSKYVVVYMGESGNTEKDTSERNLPVDTESAELLDQAKEVTRRGQKYMSIILMALLLSAAGCACVIIYLKIKER